MMQNHLEYTFLIGSERTVKVQIFVGTSEPPQQLMDDLDEKMKEVKEGWKRKVMEELEKEFPDELPV